MDNKLTTVLSKLYYMKLLLFKVIDNFTDILVNNINGFKVNSFIINL